MGSSIVARSSIRLGTAYRRRIIVGGIVAKPLILLTNDDGIYAQGILAAWQELRKVGDVEVVAPDAERSAEMPSSLRSEEHTSELQSLAYLVCRLLLEKKKPRSE